MRGEVCAPLNNVGLSTHRCIGCRDEGCKTSPSWWRRRKHLLAQANDAPAPTERWAPHIEKPFIEKIKADAETEHVTVTEVINRIIRSYYGK
jgi:hypothetical protein